jgi:hypothetical protein
MGNIISIFLLQQYFQKNKLNFLKMDPKIIVCKIRIIKMLAKHLHKEPQL